METIILTQPSLRGLKYSQCLPLLSVIADQNGLNLSKIRDFRIAKRILLISMAQN